MCNLIQTNISDLFANDREINNCRKEIFPIIIMAQYLKYKKVQFVGTKGNSIDAILKNNDNDILNVECTTSIDYKTKQIISEYNQEYGICNITPRTKAINIGKNEEAQNNSDILFNGSRHKRKIEQQNNASFEECLIDDNLIKQYTSEDIQQISNKIQKGIDKDCYKEFTLLLSVEHVLPKEKLQDYKKIIYDYWINISKNPFAGLFIVIYDYLLCSEYYKDESYNPSLMPVPIFFSKNKYESN